jgi:hypothetical protein
MSEKEVNKEEEIPETEELYEVDDILGEMDAMKD